MRGRNLFIVLTVVLFCHVVRAQETTGKIEGRVTDAQSLAVPGVAVTAV